MTKIRTILLFVTYVFGISSVNFGIWQSLNIEYYVIFVTFFFQLLKAKEMNWLKDFFGPIGVLFSQFWAVEKSYKNIKIRHIPKLTDEIQKTIFSWTHRIANFIFMTTTCHKTAEMYFIIRNYFWAKFSKIKSHLSKLYLTVQFESF